MSFSLFVPPLLSWRGNQSQFSPLRARAAKPYLLTAFQFFCRRCLQHVLFLTLNNLQLDVRELTAIGPTPNVRVQLAIKATQHSNVRIQPAIKASRAAIQAAFNNAAEEPAFTVSQAKSTSNN